MQVVWQLPHTFRFELRVSRNLSRLQVSMRPLTQAVRRNYDVQFVQDFPSVIDYIVKYIGKPEASSSIYKTMMASSIRASDEGSSMAHICAAAMNDVSIRFGDTTSRDLDRNSHLQ